MSPIRSIVPNARRPAITLAGGLAAAWAAAASPADAARVVQVREAGPAVVRLTDEVVIPGEDAGYMLVLPDPPEGLVVTFASGRDTSSAGYEMRLYEPAIAANLAFAFVTTGSRIDFFFADSTLARADGYLARIVDEHDIPRENLFFAGMSLSGTRALRYAMYCAQGKAASGLVPRAIAVCDAPLDMVRFWRECEEAEALGFHPAAAAEGAWVTDHLEANLGGTPDDARAAYVAYSPYAHDASGGGNASLFTNIAIRAYTEPDVEWWLETRRKDYYAMNATDLAALVRALLILGNDEAELVTTHGKGHHPDGTRHPHSWSIVDNAELVAWFVERAAR